MSIDCGEPHQDNCIASCCAAIRLRERDQARAELAAARQEISAWQDHDKKQVEILDDLSMLLFGESEHEDDELPGRLRWYMDDRDELATKLAAAQAQLEEVTRSNDAAHTSLVDAEMQLEAEREAACLEAGLPSYLGRAIMDELTALRKISKVCEECNGARHVHFRRAPCHVCKGLGAVVREEVGRG